MAKCKCKSNPRIISDVISSMNTSSCLDICSNPICGDPKVLGIYAPVIYDEIGINLCTSFALGADIPTTYPTATNATAKVIGATYTYGSDNVVIETITGRPNCYRVTLSNITIQFAVNLYDSACRLLTTLYPTAVYLPSDTTAPTYDEDTNPTSVELELYAPYGHSYDTTGATPAPAINFSGFTTVNNAPSQGINMFGMGKLLDFDIDESTATVGLTLVLQSLYYAGYKVPTSGKIDIPKGSIFTPEDSDCMRFVAGDLLNLAIKPLNLGYPANEEDLKQKCCDNSDNCCPTCSSCNPCDANNPAVDDTIAITPTT